MLLLHTSFLLNWLLYTRFTLVSHLQLLHLMLELVRSNKTRWIGRLKVPRCLIGVSEQSAVKIAIYILLKGRVATSTMSRH